MRAFVFIKYIYLFTWEVIKANIQVAKLLFVKNEEITPAIVAVPLDVKKDHQILVLSSMITLTPGTLSLDVSEDKSKLFVHVIHTADPEQTITEIKTGFENWVKEMFP
ncbi:MAG: Na+/H+ antiporter subunit E [Bdellovibrionia bacterium]